MANLLGKDYSLCTAEEQVYPKMFTGQRCQRIYFYLLHTHIVITPVQEEGRNSVDTTYSSVVMVLLFFKNKANSLIETTSMSTDANLK